MSKKIIESANGSDFNDLEDAIQYYCALSVNKIDCIITRDLKGFKKSSIQVMNTEELISFIENKH